MTPINTGSLLFLLPVCFVLGGNPDAKRLYDDLLSNYNKLVRPVVNVSEAVTVRLKLKLSQLIDVVSEYSVEKREIHSHRKISSIVVEKRLLSRNFC